MSPLEHNGITGHSITEIILSPERIDYTAIDSPDYFVLISEDGLKKSRGLIEKLASSATLYAEESIDLPPTDAKIVRLPFVATAKKVNRLSIGIVALAAMLCDSELFPLDALKDSISAFQKNTIADVNLKATEAGVKIFQGCCRSLHNMNPETKQPRHGMGYGRRGLYG